MTRVLRPTTGWSRAAVALLGIGAFTSPMDAVRVEPVGALADVVLLAAVVVIAVQWVRSRSRVRVGAFSGELLGAAVLAMGGLIGTFFSPIPGVSLTNLARFAVTACLLPFAVAIARPAPASLRLLLWAYVCGTSANGLLSLLELSPVTGRADGWSSHPNVLGLSSAFGLVLLAGLWDAARPGRRWPAVALAAPLLLGIARSGSRAAVGVLFVGGLVYVVASRRYRLVVVGTAALVLGLTLLGTGLCTPEPTSALGRVVTPSESTVESDAERAVLTETVLDRIKEHLATGTGFGFATQAHNIYLQIVDIGGLIGVVGFGVMAAWIVHVLVRCRREPMVAGVLGMYVGYLAGGFVINTLWDRWLWVPVIVGLAAAGGEPATTDAASPASDRSGRRLDSSS